MGKSLSTAGRMASSMCLSVLVSEVSFSTCGDHMLEGFAFRTSVACDAFLRCCLCSTGRCLAGTQSGDEDLVSGNISTKLSTVGQRSIVDCPLVAPRNLHSRCSPCESVGHVSDDNQSNVLPLSHQSSSSLLRVWQGWLEFPGIAVISA